MTETNAAVLDAAVASEAAPADSAVPAHVSHRKTYLRIYAILTVMTVIEVLYALGYDPTDTAGSLLSFGVLVVGLVVMAFFKAGLVALYFMHLKTEPFALHVIVVFPLFLVAGFFAWTLSAEMNGYPRLP